MHARENSRSVGQGQATCLQGWTSFMLSCHVLPSADLHPSEAGTQGALMRTGAELCPAEHPPCACCPGAAGELEARLIWRPDAPATFSAASALLMLLALVLLMSPSKALFDATCNRQSQQRLKCSAQGLHCGKSLLQSMHRTSADPAAGFPGAEPAPLAGRTRLCGHH